MSKSNYLDIIRELSLGFLEHTGLYGSVQGVTVHEELFYIIVAEVLEQNEMDIDPKSFKEIDINLDYGKVTLKKGHK